MSFIIRKLFKYEMAHALTSCYSEECKSIHGHSYVLEVIIEADCLNIDGMVMDFKKLKEIVKKRVLQDFDHALVLQTHESAQREEFFLPNDLHSKIVFVDYNPTAEMMAKDIYQRLCYDIKIMVRTLTNLSIRLHETATGYAEYSGRL